MVRQVVGRGAAAKVYHYGNKCIELDAFVSGFAKDERLAVLEEKCFAFLGGLLGVNFERSIVEHVAVLVYLEERCAFVVVCPAQHGLQVLGVAVLGAGGKATVDA